MAACGLFIFLSALISLCWLWHLCSAISKCYQSGGAACMLLPPWRHTPPFIFTVCRVRLILGGATCLARERHRRAPQSGLKCPECKIKVQLMGWETYYWRNESCLFIERSPTAVAVEWWILIRLAGWTVNPAEKRHLSKHFSLINKFCLEKREQKMCKCVSLSHIYLIETWLFIYFYFIFFTEKQ